MKLYLKQKVWSWTDKFTVKDENQNDVYTARGEFSFGHKLHLNRADSGEEVAFITQKVWSFLPKYYINMPGKDAIEVLGKFSFKPKFEIPALGWRIEGNFWEHAYTIFAADGAVLAQISKKWFSWGDSYELDIADAADPDLILSVVLVCDAVLADKAAAAAAT